MRLESFPSSPGENPDSNGLQGDDRNRTGARFPSSWDMGEAACEGYYNLGCSSSEPGEVLRRVLRAGGGKRVNVYTALRELGLGRTATFEAACALLDDLWRLRNEVIRNQIRDAELEKVRARLEVEKERTRERHITPTMRRQVLKRDGHKCRLCDATEDLHLDHIVPFSQGGSCHVDNLQTLCRAHNLAKRAHFLDLGSAA